MPEQIDVRSGKLQYRPTTALKKITGRYGNRDQRPKGSVHRKSAQMAADVTNCLHSSL
jgi:hypothetical protein